MRIELDEVPSTKSGDLQRDVQVVFDYVSEASADATLAHPVT